MAAASTRYIVRGAQVPLLLEQRGTAATDEPLAVTLSTVAFGTDRPGHADAVTQRRRLARRRDGLVARISRSRRRLGVNPQDLGNFFLKRHDRLRPLQLPLEPAVLHLELLHARVNGAGCRPPPAPAHLAQRPRLVPPPVRQRRVQPLATQQGPHLAGLLARVGLREDAEPIFCGEAPALDRRRRSRF